MKALVKTRPEPGIWVEDIEAPTPGANDVIVRVQKSAICGTDLHIVKWDDWAQRTISVPMAIGHEFMGVVDAVGSEVDVVEIGQRVSAEGHITCGRCRNCRAGRRRFCANTIGLGVDRPGAFAELVSIPSSNIFPVPDDIDDRTAAVLDPLGNATHTALAFDLVGEDVLITGAGPIGMMAAAIARHVGARWIVVTDVNDFRLGIAASMGSTRTVNVATSDLTAAMGELEMTEGFDVGLEMSGVGPALDQMIDSMITGGNIALLGIPSTSAFPIDWNDIIFKGLTMKGIYGRRMFETWYKMTTMLQTGLDISPAITHEFAAADFADAFETLEGGECGKVLLDWS